MKKLWLAIGLAGVLAVPTAQAAYDGKIGMTYGSAHTSPGGEFRVNVLSGLTGVILDGNTLNGYGGFETFCVEYNEYIQIGTLATDKQYDANLNSGAILGGVAGGTPDPISLGTAWLYSKFRSNPGSLGYGNTATDAGNLQKAFWYLEQEITLTASQIAANTFLQALVTPFGSVTAAKANAPAGYLGVVALNLYNGPSYTVDATYGKVNQSQLALVPEPTTMIAGALLLLPFGASTLRFLRKNRAV